MPEKAWIHWGGALDEIQRYEEETPLAEMNAFLSGVYAATNALGCEEFRQFDTKEEVEVFLAEEGIHATGC
jgi:hypothetical protein